MGVGGKVVEDGTDVDGAYALVLVVLGSPPGRVEEGRRHAGGNRL